jgi:hypothetical protein
MCRVLLFESDNKRDLLVVVAVLYVILYSSAELLHKTHRRHIMICRRIGLFLLFV